MNCTLAAPHISFLPKKILYPFHQWRILHFTSGICREHPIPAVWGWAGPSAPFFHPAPRHCSQFAAGSKCRVCDIAAPFPVPGNLQLPQRGMCGNPVVSLALEMIICNHSLIPAKELPHTRLESSWAPACANHSSSNYHPKPWERFNNSLFTVADKNSWAHHPLSNEQATH